MMDKSIVLRGNDPFTKDNGNLVPDRRLQSGETSRILFLAEAGEQTWVYLLGLTVKQTGKIHEMVFLRHWRQAVLLSAL